MVRKVSFRREFSKDHNRWEYLCIFPEDKTPHGYGFVIIHAEWHGLREEWVSEPYDYGHKYLFDTYKAIRADNPNVGILVSALKSIYGGEYKAVRMTYR